MLENQGVYLSVFLIFLALMIFIGIWVSKRVKSGEDFLMGGRSLTVPLLIGTTVATMVGTGSSMGAVGFAYANGWAGALYGLGGSIGIFALLLLFANVRKYNFMTFSEELSFYYGANRFVKGFAAMLLFVAEVGWLGAHILGGSMYLAWITGIDPTWAKIITAVGFGLYTLIGGYLAVVYTDIIQGSILFIGFLLLVILSLIKIGGMEAISQGLSSDMLSFLGISKLGLIPAISLAVVIAIGVLATPSYRHRIYSGESMEAVKKSFFITGILFAIFSIFPAIVGMSAHILDPSLESGYAFPFLATEVFPIWLGAIFLVAGLCATMSSGDSDAIAGVTILLRDVYQVFTGKLPDKAKMIFYSRISLVITILLALIFTLGATSIIGYITKMISTVMSGLFIAALLGKFWSRATWQGGIASLLGGSIVSFIILGNESLLSFWGNPIIPSLIGALAAGVVVSYITPKNNISKEEALKILAEERSVVDVGTSPSDYTHSS